MSPSALLAAVLRPLAEADPIDAVGWTFLILSVGSVTALAAWCFLRVLGHAPDGDHR